MKTIELRRHTANEGDRLTDDGAAAAVRIGRTLEGGYAVAVSSGAQRATQTIGCLLAGLGQPVPDGVVVVDELRSHVEDRWRAAYRAAGAGDLASLREVDPELVEQDSAVLASGLRRVLALLPDGARALVVGHSPTNEAAIYGLTGEIVAPLGKGEGVVVVAEADGFAVTPVE
jgi:broad specificity phosphatase PhoE